MNEEKAFNTEIRDFVHKILTAEPYTVSDSP